jgi:uncharacterized protein (DUF433 family)
MNDLDHEIGTTLMLIGSAVRNLRIALKDDVMDKSISANYPQITIRDTLNAIEEGLKDINDKLRKGENNDQN